MRAGKLKLVLAASLIAGLAGTSDVWAGAWQQHHPRRAEVNHRLDRQWARIHAGRAHGKLTGQQARQLHREDHQIRQQERQMAAHNGGHITKAEQRALNQEENAVSSQIFQEKHPGQ